MRDDFSVDAHGHTAYRMALATREAGQPFSSESSSSASFCGSRTRMQPWLKVRTGALKRFLVGVSCM